MAGAIGATVSARGDVGLGESAYRRVCGRDECRCAGRRSHREKSGTSSNGQLVLAGKQSVSSRHSYFTRLPRRLRRRSRAATDFLGCSRRAARRAFFFAIAARKGVCLHFRGSCVRRWYTMSSGSFCRATLSWRSLRRRSANVFFFGQFLRKAFGHFADRGVSLSSDASFFCRGVRPLRLFTGPRSPSRRNNLHSGTGPRPPCVAGSRVGKSDRTSADLN